MEPMTSQSLDLRTLLLLLTDERLPHDKVLELIADECHVPVQQLTDTFVVRTQPKQQPVAQPESKPAPVRQHHRASRNYSRWTDERVNELVHRWNNGERPSSIAEAMGVSTQVVYQKVSKLRKTRSDIQARESKNPAFASLTSV